MPGHAELDRCGDQRAGKLRRGRVGNFAERVNLNRGGVGSCQSPHFPGGKSEEAAAGTEVRSVGRSVLKFAVGVKNNIAVGVADDAPAIEQIAARKLQAGAVARADDRGRLELTRVLEERRTAPKLERAGDKLTARENGVCEVVRETCAGVSEQLALDQIHSPADEISLENQSPVDLRVSELAVAWPEPDHVHPLEANQQVLEGDARADWDRQELLDAVVLPPRPAEEILRARVLAARVADRADLGAVENNIAFFVDEVCRADCRDLASGRCG